MARFHGQMGAAPGEQMIRWPRHLQASPLALAALLLAGCGPQAEDSAGAPPPPREVEVVTLAAEPLAIAAELPGRVEPVRVAEVRARVAGIVLARHFEEGAEVKAGDRLFDIDPAPFKAALARAEARLAQAEATLFDAQATLRRYQSLEEVDAISQQQFDAARAAEQSARAARRSAQADIETARLDLGYASVRAPIDGRIGRALVTEGALVGQGDATLMARIQQIDPIYVDFTQPVADALQVRAAIAQGRLSGSPDDRLELRLDGSGYRAEGRLLFADVEVDPSTDQMSLRGRFANPDRVLLPGMYARVRVTQAVDEAALLVPQRAVRRGGDGQASVMVVNAEGLAEARPVTTGVMSGARWQVTEGLAPGDRVIVGGANMLAPGEPVQVREAAEAAR